MIEFHNASFAYGRAEVLRDVTLTVAPGAFHFLAGASGAGKTTFLRLCYRDLVPSAGAISFFGGGIAPADRDATAALRRRIGVVPQDCAFLDHLPVAANIALPLTVGGLAAESRAADLAALIEWVDLGSRAEALPPELSGGERQRAALARAVILSPEVILVDEPTGNVDWKTAVRLTALLIELNRMGRAVLVATHDLELVRWATARVRARVSRLAAGRVEDAGADP